MYARNKIIMSKVMEIYIWFDLIQKIINLPMQPATLLCRKVKPINIPTFNKWECLFFCAIIALRNITILY